MTGVIRNAANLGLAAFVAACTVESTEKVSIWFPTSTPEREAYLQSDAFQEIFVARCAFDRTVNGDDRYEDRLPFEVVMHDETGDGGFAISNGYDAMEMLVRTVEDDAEVYSSMYSDGPPNTVIRVNDDQSAILTLRSMDYSASATFAGACVYGNAYEVGDA